MPLGRARAGVPSVACQPQLYDVALKYYNEFENSTINYLFFKYFLISFSCHSRSCVIAFISFEEIRLIVFIA